MVSGVLALVTSANSEAIWFLKASLNPVKPPEEPSGILGLYVVVGVALWMNDLWFGLYPLKLLTAKELEIVTIKKSRRVSWVFINVN